LEAKRRRSNGNSTRIALPFGKPAKRHTQFHTHTHQTHIHADKAVLPGQCSCGGGGGWEGKDFSARERAKSIVPDFRPVDGRDTVRTVCAGRPYARASPGKCCRPHRDFGPVFRRGGGGVLVSAPPYCVSKHSRTRAWNAHCERNKGESAVDVS